jgi:hypothetical protein
MSGYEASVPPADKANVASHLEQLPPPPEGKVFAVTLLPLFEFFPGLPIFLFAEPVLLGNVFADRQKLRMLSHWTRSGWLR